MGNIKEKWEFYGENDPYFAVVTIDEFRRENLDETAKDQFFKTGEDHVAKIWSEIQENFVSDFKPEKALDFGCGVGRLVVPLAEKCGDVTGVDISEQMLKEASLNCEKRDLRNTSFQQTEAFMADKNQKFDFVHSFIVFQHINPLIGYKIIENIVEKLQNGGVGALHFTYFNPTGNFQSLKFKIYRDFPFTYKLKNLILAKNKDPLIPMYIYDLNFIFSILQKNFCSKIQIKFSHHGYLGAVVMFQKNDSATLDY